MDGGEFTKMIWDMTVVCGSILCGKTVYACFPSIIIDHCTFFVPAWVANYIPTMALYLVIPDEEDITKTDNDDNHIGQIQSF